MLPLPTLPFRMECVFKTISWARFSSVACRVQDADLLYLPARLPGFMSCSRSNELERMKSAVALQ